MPFKSNKLSRKFSSKEDYDSDDSINPVVKPGIYNMDTRAKTASLAGSSRNPEGDLDSLDDFDLNNSKIFQSVDVKKTANDSANRRHSDVSHDSIPCDLESASGLPSASCLLGGRKVIAKGRHGNMKSRVGGSTGSLRLAESQASYSSVNSTNGGRNSRFSNSIGSTSPSSPRRNKNNQLTPGLKGEERRGRGRRKTESNASSRSNSLSPQVRKF